MFRHGVCCAKRRDSPKSSILGITTINGNRSIFWVEIVYFNWLDSPFREGEISQLMGSQCRPLAARIDHRVLASSDGLWSGKMAFDLKSSGKHEVSNVTRGKNTRRYPVWKVRFVSWLMQWARSAYVPSNQTRRGGGDGTTGGELGNPSLRVGGRI